MVVDPSEKYQGNDHLVSRFFTGGSTLLRTITYPPVKVGDLESMIIPNFPVWWDMCPRSLEGTYVFLFPRRDT